MDYIASKKLICNGIYTHGTGVYIILNDLECLYLHENNILKNTHIHQLSNEVVSKYISMYLSDVTLFDILSFEFLDKVYFEDGYLGIVNELGLQSLEKFKEEWATI